MEHTITASARLRQKLHLSHGQISGAGHLVAGTWQASGAACYLIALASLFAIR